MMKLYLGKQSLWGLAVLQSFCQPKLFLDISRCFQSRPLQLLTVLKTSQTVGQKGLHVSGCDIDERRFFFHSLTSPTPLFLLQLTGFASVKMYVGLFLPGTKHYKH